MRRVLPLLLCVGCAAPAYRYHRVYAPGDVYRYRLTTASSVNGAAREPVSAVSVHEVVGPPPLRERIHFEGDLASVPPYELSLAADAPKGALALPSLAGLDGGAVGMVTDLHTFFVAVSPKTGKEPARGDWGIGQDCILISRKVVAEDAGQVTFETSFEPPARPCLTPRAPWMEAPVVAGVPNNFQQVRKGDGGSMPMWGRERFVVRSVVRRRDGLILRATMDNELTLKVRLACDESLSNCQGEAPVTMRRSLELTLL